MTVKKPVHALLPGEFYISPDVENLAEHYQPIEVVTVETAHVAGRTVTKIRGKQHQMVSTVPHGADAEVTLAPKPPVLHSAYIPAENRWYCAIEYAGPLSLDLNDATVWEGDTEATAQEGDTEAKPEFVPGGRYRVCFGPDGSPPVSSDPDFWQIPPVGTILTYVEGPDSDGDVHGRSDSALPNPTASGTETKNWWILPQYLRALD